MLLWFLVAFLLTGTWVGGYFLEWSLVLKLWLTAAVVVMVIAVYLIRRWRAVRAARALERELMKQAEAQANNARPDRRAEIGELQLQFQKGLQSLKTTKLGNISGAQALYALPWYMIIGPPGAGKTTALKQSGLEFPFLDPNGGGVRGVGGTRNCDWWFTNEGILLDTAGRYTTEQDDRDEWLAFLELLKRFRPKKPLNGVLVAVSVSDLASATEEQVDSYAKRIRARIDEVMTRLEMVVPVYLMFTKADLVAGFVEFFGNLRKSERGEIFGATFPLAPAAGFDPGKAMEGEFDDLVKTLHSRSIARLSSERAQDQRQKIFQFPLEFQVLRDNLTDFVGALFSKNTYQETPIFRGFYFTSGTQEGRPMDRVVGSMARAFGLRGTGTEASDTPKESKSYFVTDMFKRVVFPDQSVAARTMRETRRLRYRRVMYALAALALGGCLMGPAACTYINNMKLVDNAKSTATEAVDAWKEESKVVAQVTGMDALLGLTDKIRDWEKKGAPIDMRWGMYVGDTLYKPLRNVYLGILKQHFERPVKKELEGRLRAIDANVSTRSAEQFNREVEALKLYLLMSEIEHLSDRPSLEKSNEDWARERLVPVWQTALKATSSKELDEGMKRHVEFYMELLRSKEVKPWTLDRELVTKVRSILTKVPKIEPQFEELVRQVNKEEQGYTLSNIIPPSDTASTFIKSAADPTGGRLKKVEGAYTKPGWARIKGLLDDTKTRLTAEQWVLGDGESVSDKAVSETVKQLRELYFRKYAGQWAEFLKDIQVDPPKNTKDSLEEIRALISPEHPYQKILSTVAKNVNLVEKAAAEDPSTADKVKGKLLDKAIEKGKKKVGAGAADLVPGKGKDEAITEDRSAYGPEELERDFLPLIRFVLPAEAPKAGVAAPLTQMDQYHKILTELSTHLQDLNDMGSKPTDTKVMATEFQTAFRQTTALLADQSGFTRPPLSHLLLMPIRMGWSSVMKGAGDAAGGLWEVSVWEDWTKKLDKKYPFADSTVDVPLNDFIDFFKPNTGLLWGFYEGTLKSTLERKGPTFVPATRFASGPARGGVPYTGPFMKCLERGIKITEATFPDKAEKPLVEFEVKLHSVSKDVSEVVLEVDGQTLTYKNEPERWLKLGWPGKDQKGAKLRARGDGGLDEEISRTGDFGLYRLLDAADVKTVSGKSPDGGPFTASWDLKTGVGGFVKIDFRPAKSDHAFVRNLFKGYECPRLITSRD